jgi:hypothetical protein
MYLYMGLALMVLAGLSLLIPFRVIINYQLLQGDHELHVGLTWLGISLFWRQFPVGSSREPVDKTKAEVERDEEKVVDELAENTDARDGDLMDGMESVLELAHHYRLMFDVITSFAFGGPSDLQQMSLGKPLLGHVWAVVYPFTRHFERLHWYTRVGLGDAAATAIAVGVLSGVLATGFTWLDGRVYLNPEGVHWQVIPNYSQRQTDVAIYCILRVNAGHIIITGVANLWRVGVARMAYWKNKFVH